MWMAVIVTPIQIFAGDLHGLNTLEHQPQKVMAMEGHFHSYDSHAPLILFGIVDEENKEVDFAIEVPGLSSLILKHDLNAPLAGLDTIPDEDEPPVWIVFYSFRIMIGIGMAMLAVGLWSAFARFRGTLYESPWLHRTAILMGPTGFIAVLAGWITTEVGRQPWIVHGLMRTEEAVTDGGWVWYSFIGLTIVYSILGIAGLTVVIAR